MEYKSRYISYSFCIASSGRKDLLHECIKSILSLEISSFEILIGSSSVEIGSFKSDRVRFFKTKDHVGQTRNKLKSEANGQWLFFLDEDVKLTDKKIIDKLLAIDKVKNADIYGGHYGSVGGSSNVDRAYNMTCNLWVLRGRYHNCNVLGGVYVLKGKKFPNYYDAFAFGGEEYPYFSNLAKLKYKIHTTNALTVVHQPQHNLVSFFKRAWLHGKYKQEEVIKGDRVSLFLKYPEKILVKFLAGLYFFVVYMSQFVNNNKLKYMLFRQTN